MRYAVVRDDVVENIVEWDGVLADEQHPDAWMPPEGTDVIPLPEGVGIGWRRQGAEWVQPDGEATV